MTDLLTGLDLDRAIAEAKGWTKIFVSSVPDLRGTHRDGSGPWAIKRWHADPALALGLWEEMAGGWRLSNQADGPCRYHLFGPIFDDTVSFIELNHNDFCVIIGNAYLQWQGQQKGTR